MSYDIDLINPETDKPFEYPEDNFVEQREGTSPVGGRTETSINITYNYSPIFVRVLGEEGIRSIYGMTAKESFPILRAAIGQLKGDVDDDYWKPTEGNARLALIQLLEMACKFPEGVWRGD